MQPNAKASTVIRCIIPHPDTVVYIAWRRIGRDYIIQQAKAKLEAAGKLESFERYVSIADKAEDFLRRAIGLNLPIPIGTTIKIPNAVELVVSRFEYEFRGEELILLCLLNYLK